MQDIFEIMGGKNGRGNPQFPGMQKGATISDVRTFIKKQKRVKGYNVTVDNGTTNVDLQLSGTARLFLGFAIITNPLPGLAPDSVTLTINNEIVVDQVKPNFFNANFTDEEYYFIPRPLSGTDEITMTFLNSAAVQDAYIVVYYL